MLFWLGTSDRSDGKGIKYVCTQQREAIAKTLRVVSGLSAERCTYCRNTSSQVVSPRFLTDYSKMHFTNTAIIHSDTK